MKCGVVKHALYRVELSGKRLDLRLRELLKNAGLPLREGAAEIEMVLVEGV